MSYTPFTPTYKYAELATEALPSVASSTQIFVNAPAATKEIVLTLRTAGITYTLDGSAATAGGTGHDLALNSTTSPYVLPYDYTQALLVRAIQNGGTATGTITYRG